MYQNVSAPLGAALTGTAGAGATDATGITSGVLPFTGLSPVMLVVMLLAGVAMLALGGALRRLVPKRQA